jgi:hypothetical protein
MNEKIKILICDDHTLFREGIKAILEGEQWIEKPMMGGRRFSKLGG